MTITLSHLQENAVYNFALIRYLPYWKVHIACFGASWGLIWYTKGHPDVFCERTLRHQVLSVNSLCLASEGSLSCCSAHREVTGVCSWKWGLRNHWTFVYNGCAHVTDRGLFHITLFAFSHILSTSPFVDATLNTGQSVLCFSNLYHFLDFFFW